MASHLHSFQLHPSCIFLAIVLYRLSPRTNECWAGPGDKATCVCGYSLVPRLCKGRRLARVFLSLPGGKTALVCILPLTCAALAGPDGLSEDTLREAILTLETKVQLRVLVPDVSGRVMASP